MGLSLLKYKNKLLLQRLGAWYYKEYRNAYELHKSCFLKFGCTFIFVLLQIMCDKNYTCKNKRYLSPKISVPEKNKKQTMNEIELSLEQLENETCFDQPGSKNFSQSHSCCPKSHVTFSNENSTLPPSFNLQSAQKSTPKRQASNASCSLPFQTANSHTLFQTANSHTPFKTANSPSETVVSIETHQSANDAETIV